MSTRLHVCFPAELLALIDEHREQTAEVLGREVSRPAMVRALCERGVLDSGLPLADLVRDDAIRCGRPPGKRQLAFPFPDASDTGGRP
jgi:hypothetical protein